MTFTAQDYEKFMNRRVMLVTCLDQRVIGTVLEGDSQNYGGIVYLTTISDSGTTFRKGVSATAIDGVWDMDVLWNECPQCWAKPGNECSTDEGAFKLLAHPERFAGHQADKLVAKKKKESSDLSKLAAKHTQDSVIAGALPATTR